MLGYTVDLYGWDGGFIILVGSCVTSIVCFVYALLGERAIHERKAKEKAALAQ